MASTKNIPKKATRGEKIWRSIQNYWYTTDRWLLLLCLILSTASVVYLYAMKVSGLTERSKVITQVAAVALGLTAALIISMINYRSLVKLWKLFMPLAVMLVIFTFFWGVEKGVANKAWLYIPVGGRYVSIQPAEFLKISFIATFSLHLNHVREKINKPMTLLLLVLHGGAHIGLIAAQGDDGTALVFVGIFAIMMFMSGVDWKYILLALVLVLALVPVAWKFVLSPYQKDRFRVLWTPDIDPDLSFQQDRGLLALGFGGVQGVGLFADKHVKVPVADNDFIFTFIGETTGLIGTLAVLVLLLCLCFKILYNSSVAIDMTGRMICVGVFAMILVQAVINIGMCLKILPVIGVTLPFLSSGGSSVLALYIGIGLVISVYRHSELGFFSKKT